MCETTDISDGCGNFTDLPEDWGHEKLDSDEIAILVIGILLDLCLSGFFGLIVLTEYGELIRNWIHDKYKGKLPPYEKVADYLRSAENFIAPSVVDKIPRLSIGEIEDTGAFVEDKPIRFSPTPSLGEHGIKQSKTTGQREGLIHKSTRKKRDFKKFIPTTLKSVSTALKPSGAAIRTSTNKSDLWHTSHKSSTFAKKHHKKPKIQDYDQIRMKRRSHKPYLSSRSFLPISKAKPDERPISSRETSRSHTSSPSSASSTERSRRSPEISSAYVTLSRRKLKWDK